MLYVRICIKAANIVEKDKKNYLSYYKRALSYLGLSRYHAAITDLDSVLEIQPDFSAALLQRGKILAWQGDFSGAVKDLQKAQKQDELVCRLRHGTNDRLMISKKQDGIYKRLKVPRKREIIKSALNPRGRR
jgi:tetratricopeptide (TPR) repeat protein